MIAQTWVCWSFQVLVSACFWSYLLFPVRYNHEVLHRFLTLNVVIYVKIAQNCDCIHFVTPCQQQLWPKITCRHYHPERPVGFVCLSTYLMLVCQILLHCFTDLLVVYLCFLLKFVFLCASLIFCRFPGEMF